MSEAQKVLIIDDDTDFSESNKDLLEAYGYEVATAPDGEQGIAKALELIPDLVVLDMMMTHDTEGFDVARKLRETPELSTVAILLVTGMRKALKLDRSPEPDAEWLPVDRVLEKPIDPALLMKEIERVLEERNKKGAE